VVNVTNRTNVHVWLGTFKFAFCHDCFPLIQYFKYQLFAKSIIFC